MLTLKVKLKSCANFVFKILQLMQTEKASGRSCSVWQIWNQSNKTKKAWDGLIWCSVWRMMWSFQLFTFIVEIANFWLNVLKSTLHWMSKYQTTLSSVKYRLLVYINHIMHFRLITSWLLFPSFFLLVEIVFKVTETVVSHMHLESYKWSWKIVGLIYEIFRNLKCY